MRVEKDYRFTTEDGDASLRDLFGGHSQMLVYHFMFDPDWNKGCPSCSAVSDGFSGSVPHFEHHDVAFVVVSRAPFDKLVAYKRRMGWDFRWVSSSGSSFNYDFHVTIDPAVAPVEYNYKDRAQLEAENVAWRDWSISPTAPAATTTTSGTRSFPPGSATFTASSTSTSESCCTSQPSAHAASPGPR